MNDVAATAAERLALVEQTIVGACTRAGRRRAEVTLIGISKFQPADKVIALARAGVTTFGENYAAELRDKRAAVADAGVDVRWHFVGRVQRGNARLIASADLVHGVGTVGQAEALAHAAQRRTAPLPILLQLNLEDDDAKNGFSAATVRAAGQQIAGLDGLDIVGVMAMPMVPWSTPSTAAAAGEGDGDGDGDGEEKKKEREQEGDPAAGAMLTDGPLVEAFRRVVETRSALAEALGRSLPVVSLGMSADFGAAIVAGATHIRVGTALFGPRPSPSEPGSG